MDVVGRSLPPACARAHTSPKEGSEPAPNLKSTKSLGMPTSFGKRVLGLLVCQVCVFVPEPHSPEGMGVFYLLTPPPSITDLTHHLSHLTRMTLRFPPLALTSFSASSDEKTTSPVLAPGLAGRPLASTTCDKRRNGRQLRSQRCLNVTY